MPERRVSIAVLYYYPDRPPMHYNKFELEFEKGLVSYRDLADALHGIADNIEREHPTTRIRSNRFF